MSFIRSCGNLGLMAMHLQADKNWTEHVVVDGKLVTGQNPQVSFTATHSLQQFHTLGQHLLSITEEAPFSFLLSIIKTLENPHAIETVCP